MSINGFSNSESRSKFITFDFSRIDAVNGNFLSVSMNAITPKISSSSLVSFSSAKLATDNLTNIVSDFSVTAATQNKNEIYVNDRDSLINSCLKEFLSVATNDEYEYGYRSLTDDLIEKFSIEHPAETGNIIQQIYLRSKSDSLLSTLLIKAISELSYEKIYPYGQMVALASLSSEYLEVNDAGIRAFEKWEHKDGISNLENQKMNVEWLEQYRLSTIEFLKAL